LTVPLGKLIVCLVVIEIPFLNTLIFANLLLFPQLEIGNTVLQMFFYWHRNKQSGGW